MNAALRNMAISFSVDLVADLLKDMATPSGVIEWRDKVVALGEKLTGKTATEIDDRIWRFIALNLLTPENWSKYGKDAVVWLKQYAMHSDTKYDDYAIPILIALESAFAGADTV